MKQRLKTIAMTIALGLGLTVGLTAPMTVSAQAGGASGKAKADVCAGINVAGGACADNGSGISNVIRTVIQILSLVAGVAAVIMVVVGGLRYITSGGDSSKVASAKTAIIYAIVGLVIVALAQIIVRFVLTQAQTGTGAGPGAAI